MVADGRATATLERFHQTLNRWLAATSPPATTDELQALLNAFVDSTKDDQPTGRPPGPKPRRRPAIRGSGCFRCPATSQGRAAGI